jgi:hypothetical protein
MAVLLALALPGVAHATSFCVGTSAPGCVSKTTTAAAVTAAANGDTIRFGAGTFDPVDTPKVLTYVGVGPGTIDSSSGATVIANSAIAGVAMILPHGGTLRDLRAVGGPGNSSSSAGTGVSYGTNDPGDFTLNVSNVIGTGGTPGTGPAGGAGLALGGDSPSGTQTATVTGGAFLAGPNPGDAGFGIYTCCISSTVSNTVLRSATQAVYASIGSRMTLRSSVATGQNTILTQGPALLTVIGSRITGSSTGFGITADLTKPTNVTVRDSLVTTTSDLSALAPVRLEATNAGPAVGFQSVGNTFIARGASLAAVLVLRDAPSDAPLTATLRNTVARNLVSGGVDLWADDATIAADYSSFNSRKVVNNGSAPAPGSAHNVAGDPLLAGDFSLLAGSPLIDRGDPGSVLAAELDLAGRPRSLDGSGDCVAQPDIGAFERPQAHACGSSPPAPNKAPSLSSVSVTNRVFAPVRKAHSSRKVKRGTRFRYRLSEPARVTIVIERKLKGRKRGRKCVAPTRKNRHRKRCTRYKRVTTLRASRPAGKGSTAFSGRVHGKALKPGRYRARLRATDSLGARSKEKRISLRIVKG